MRCGEGGGGGVNGFSLIMTPPRMTISSFRTAKFRTDTHRCK
jgi:hypothetical protein